MSLGITPIERKAIVAKPAIRSYLDIAELTEIVSIQLQQIGQDRLLLWSSGDYGDIIKLLCEVIRHHWFDRPDLDFEYGTLPSIRMTFAAHSATQPGWLNPWNGWAKQLLRMDDRQTD